MRFAFSKLTLARVLENELGVGRRGPDWTWGEQWRLWQGSRQEMMETWTRVVTVVVERQGAQNQKIPRGDSTGHKPQAGTKWDPEAASGKPREAGTSLVIIQPGSGRGDTWATLIAHVSEPSSEQEIRGAGRALSFGG